MVPLFPEVEVEEVRNALNRLCDLAPKGATAVFTRFTGTEQNPPTQLARWCERAGVHP